MSPRQRGKVSGDPNLRWRGRVGQRPARVGGVGWRIPCVTRTAWPGFGRAGRAAGWSFPVVAATGRVRGGPTLIASNRSAAQITGDAGEPPDDGVSDGTGPINAGPPRLTHSSAPTPHATTVASGAAGCVGHERQARHCRPAAPSRNGPPFGRWTDLARPGEPHVRSPRHVKSASNMPVRSMTGARNLTRSAVSV
jgi:hypothetical protein